MFRKRVMLGVLAEALMKWIAASRSTANVCVVAKSNQHILSLSNNYSDGSVTRGAHTRSAPPLPPAPALQKT